MQKIVQVTFLEVLDKFNHFESSQHSKEDISKIELVVESIIFHISLFTYMGELTRIGVRFVQQVQPYLGKDRFDLIKHLEMRRIFLQKFYARREEPMPLSAFIGHDAIGNKYDGNNLIYNVATNEYYEPESPFTQHLKEQAKSCGQK